VIRHYRLEGRIAVPIEMKGPDDIMEWARWFDSGRDRQVALTPIGEKCRVSTVFISLDRRVCIMPPEEPPRLFEVRVFDGPMHGEATEHLTWEEAEQGHEEMVARVTEALGLAS